MHNLVSIEKYLDFLEENHKRLIFYFDELYKEYAQYEDFKSARVNRRQRKRLENDRKEAFTIYYANLGHLIKGENVSLNFVEKKENPIKRLFKKLFRIKDKEAPILVIEDSHTADIADEEPTDERNEIAEDTIVQKEEQSNEEDKN